jgi:hypothetical protein
MVTMTGVVMVLANYTGKQVELGHKRKHAKTELSFVVYVLVANSKLHAMLT